ncbi:MAG: 2-oxoacid:acceptor oxidoreductase family protein [Desulfobacteraceae bacterium]|nr:2-oxoacid:acceptor oxidoreductase family protein [Desulfobacteraceae bacterium]
MNSLLNSSRPPVFCPGCSYERITHALDQAFQGMGLRGNQIAIVSDIGCSGLFDTFYHTHALHGLHGRALTYATGLKMARPELTVVVIMGDGGVGIGGAHFLSACRRNLDLTLLILNNFNYGMTGGQFSPTTPPEAHVGSGFLNRLERPLDACQVASSAGAAYVTRCSSYRKDLAEEIQRAIRYRGFSVIDIWGICTGRYTRRNKLTPKLIEEALGKLPPKQGVVVENVREEYGQHYRDVAASQKPVSPPAKIEAKFSPPEPGRQEVIILGGAGQRIITAGEILCFAGLTAGLKVTQKNEYDITVLRGPSISEVILSPEEIGFTGIGSPAVLMALSHEGVARRRYLFDQLDKETLVIQGHGVEVPSCNARIHRVDLKGQGIKVHDWALAALSILAKLNKVISLEMLRSALEVRFKDPFLASALDLVDRIEVRH